MKLEHFDAELFCNYYNKNLYFNDYEKRLYKRGLSLCINNPKGGILLTGINPSGTDVESNSIFYDFKYTEGSFWNQKLKLFTPKLLDKVAYLDLFPQKESTQVIFEKETSIDFRARMIETTQMEIERLMPKLVIIANKQSQYYWGFNKNSRWMGYNLERVNEEIIKGKEIYLYKINGFRPENDRINQDKLHTTHLKYILLYAMYDQRHEAKYANRILSAEQIEQLYTYLK